MHPDSSVPHLDDVGGGGREHWPKSAGGGLGMPGEAIPMVPLQPIMLTIVGGGGSLMAYHTSPEMPVTTATGTSALE